MIVEVTNNNGTGKKDITAAFLQAKTAMQGALACHKSMCEDCKKNVAAAIDGVQKQIQGML
jgi:hypothetical protein